MDKASRNSKGFFEGRSYAAEAEAVSAALARNGVPKDALDYIAANPPSAYGFMASLLLGHRDDPGRAPSLRREREEFVGFRMCMPGKGAEEMERRFSGDVERPDEGGSYLTVWSAYYPENSVPRDEAIFRLASNARVFWHEVSKYAQDVHPPADLRIYRAPELAKVA